MEERTAVRIVADQLDSIPKSVQFVPSPSPLQIIGQLQMLTNNMKFVCEYGLTLDMEMDAEQAQTCCESYMKKNNLEAHITEDLSKRRLGPKSARAKT